MHIVVSEKLYILAFSRPLFNVKLSHNTYGKTQEKDKQTKISLKNYSTLFFLLVGL